MHIVLCNARDNAPCCEHIVGNGHVISEDGMVTQQETKACCWCGNEHTITWSFLLNPPDGPLSASQYIAMMPEHGAALVSHGIYPTKRS